MKKLWILLAVLGMAGCGNQAQQPLPPEGTIEAQAVPDSGGPRTAVVIRHETGFITEFNAETKRVTKWGTPLNLGDIVYYLEEFEELVVNDQGAKWPVVKIRRGDNTEGWMYRSYAVVDALPGVILGKEATIYKQPDFAAPTAAYLVQGDFIAVSTEAVSGGFIKFTYANAAGALTENKYLKAELVSTVENDVQSARFLRLAAAARSNQQRKELLNTAAATFPSETFLPVVQAELALVEAGFNQEVLSEKTSALMDVDVLNAPFDYGAIVGSVPAGTEVTVLRKLTKDDTTWYQIDKPAGFVPGWFNVPVRADDYEEDSAVAQ